MHYFDPHYDWITFVKGGVHAGVSVTKRVVSPVPSNPHQAAAAAAAGKAAKPKGKTKA